MSLEVFERELPPPAPPRDKLRHEETKAPAAKTNPDMVAALTWTKEVAKDCQESKAAAEEAAEANSAPVEAWSAEKKRLRGPVIKKGVWPEVAAIAYAAAFVPRPAMPHWRDLSNNRGHGFDGSSDNEKSGGGGYASPWQSQVTKVSRAFDLAEDFWVERYRMFAAGPTRAAHEDGAHEDSHLPPLPYTFGLRLRPDLVFGLPLGWGELKELSRRAMTNSGKDHFLVSDKGEI